MSSGQQIMSGESEQFDHNGNFEAADLTSDRRLQANQATLVKTKKKNRYKDNQSGSQCSSVKPMSDLYP